MCVTVSCFLQVVYVTVSCFLQVVCVIVSCFLQVVCVTVSCFLQVVCDSVLLSSTAANRPFDPCSRMPPPAADVSRTTQNNTKHGRNKKKRCTLSLKRCPLSDFNANGERTMTFLFLDLFYYFIFSLYVNI